MYCLFAWFICSEWVFPWDQFVLKAVPSTSINTIEWWSIEVFSMISRFVLLRWYRSRCMEVDRAHRDDWPSSWREAWHPPQTRQVWRCCCCQSLSAEALLSKQCCPRPIVFVHDIKYGVALSAVKDSQDNEGCWHHVLRGRALYFHSRLSESHDLLFSRLT